MALFLLAALYFIFESMLQVEENVHIAGWVWWLLAFSLYLLFGRFYAKKSRKKNTFYCMTNKRFYRITKNIFGELIVDFTDILDTDELEVDGIPPESVTIVFKKIPVSFTKFFANTGLAMESKFYSFVDVRRGSKICDTITELKEQAEINRLIETREKIEEIKKQQEKAALEEIEIVDDNDKPPLF